MEIYSNTTRFAFACNNSEKIIEAIQSRCAVVRYVKLTDAEVLAKVLQVCQKEEVRINCSDYFERMFYIVLRRCRSPTQMTV